MIFSLCYGSFYFLLNLTTFGDGIIIKEELMNKKLVNFDCLAFK